MDCHLLLFLLTLHLINITRRSHNLKRTKPTTSMNNILLHASSVAKPITVSIGEAIEICPNGRRRVIFLQKGEVEIFRHHDSLLISEVRSPYTFGVMVNEVEDFYYYVRAKKNAVLAELDYNTFISIVRENDLWLDLLAITSHITSFLIHRDINLVNQDRFHVVMHFLNELYSLPQEKNETFTTTNYIVRRSGLSRSGVMAVLSELKKGKYIRIENGKLVYMSDNIPNAF